MAITSQTHFRSISLPSRLNPINPTNFETELEKLKSWPMSVNSEAIQSGLLQLAELYNSVHGLTQSPTTQKSVVFQDEKSIEESLSGSVELLDGCGAITEVFQMIRENIKALQSALRRKGLDSSVQNDISSYFCFRKKMNKSIAKTLKDLKKSEQMIKNGSDVLVNADSGLISVISELAGITMAIFRSVLVLLSSGPTGRPGSWSLVSRLMITKSGKENDVVNEVGNVDFALSSLQGKMRSINGVAILDVQKRLHNLDDIIEGFEAGLGRLFRQLVQIRVTLLNILTDH